MQKRPLFTDLVFQALSGALFLALAWAVVASWSLYSLYHLDFPEYGFWHLLLYNLGRAGLVGVALAALLALLALLVSRAPGRLGAAVGDRTASRPFALFFGLESGILLAYWGVFYVNANWLRFSREPRSWFADGFVVACCIGIATLLVTTLPIATLRVTGRARFGLAGVVVTVALLAPIDSPFARIPLRGDTAPAVESVYDADGNCKIEVPDRIVTPRNVIVLSIDTLRSDALGCYGNPQSTSPNIDAFADQGVVFENSFSQAPWTLPSHMTMITGLYPSAHGCITSTGASRSVDRLDPSKTTLAEVLRGFGYSTAAITDGRLLGPTFGFDQGFELCNDSGGGIKGVIKKTEQWLDSRSVDAPFFLFLHCYDVHHYRPPRRLEEQFAADYEGKLSELRASGRDLEIRVTSNAFYDLSSEDIRYLKGLYKGELRKTDTYFGKLITLLRERGVYDNSIIIITSDHGEEFWEHGGTGHGWSLHQHQLRVPLIIVAPALISAECRIGQAAGLIDLFPTVLDLLGFPAERTVHGRSLVPLIRGDEMPSRTLLAEAAHLGNQKAILTTEYSLLYNRFPPIGESLFDWERFAYVWRNVLRSSENEMYDLRSDPGEHRNRISEAPDLARERKGELLDALVAHIRQGGQSRGDAQIELDEETREHLRALGYIR